MEGATTVRPHLRCASDAAVTQLFSLPRTADMLEVVFQNCAAVGSANEDCVYADVDGGFLAMGVSRFGGRLDSAVGHRPSRLTANAGTGALSSDARHCSRPYPFGTP